MRSELITRQSIAPSVQLRLPAAFRRGLDEVNLTDLRRLNPVGDQIVRVRCPVRRLIGVVLLPILAELNPLAPLGRTNKEIVLMNISPPLPIRRNIPLSSIPPVAFLLPLTAVIDRTLVPGSLPGLLKLRQLMVLQPQPKILPLHPKEGHPLPQVIKKDLISF